MRFGAVWFEGRGYPIAILQSELNIMDNDVQILGEMTVPSLRLDPPTPQVKRRATRRSILGTPRRK